MRKSILKMERSVKSNIEFPKYPYSAVLCGQMNRGKTVFVLDLLQNEYQDVFENIIILCSTIEWNKAYKKGTGLATCVAQKTKI